jgi:hypothetical protein
MKTVSSYTSASFILIIGLLFLEANAQEFVLKRNQEDTVVGRAPASFMPSDDIESAPLEQQLWIDRMMVPDHAGVLERMRAEYEGWQVQQEYARNWNLDSTGLYEHPTDHQKRRYLERNFFRYVDRRISGEVRNAEEGSTFHTVGQVQDALRPNATVELLPSFRFRFRARILEGQASVLVDNPWVDCDAMVNAKGDIEVNLRKDLYWGVSAGIHYKIDDGEWETHIQKPLARNLYGRVTSLQRDSEMAFSNQSDATVQLVFSQPF